MSASQAPHPPALTTLIEKDFMIREEILDFLISKDFSDGDSSKRSSLTEDAVLKSPVNFILSSGQIFSHFLQKMHLPVSSIISSPFLDIAPAGQADIHFPSHPLQLPPERRALPVNRSESSGGLPAGYFMVSFLYFNRDLRTL